MKTLAVIPARYASSRFPGKPLVEIAGKSMIQRTYEQVMKVKGIQKVIVATDDARILNHVLEFGGDAFMTSADHPNGTDRVEEAFQKAGGSAKFEYIVNIQGDEPFIHPETIELLIAGLDYKTEIETVVKKIDNYDDLMNPNVVKAVITMRKQALYFSRQAVPFVRDYEPVEWLKHATFYRHYGIYAYRSDVLEQIVKIPVSVLEDTEKLEQLRWIGYGYKVKVIETTHESIGVDTTADLVRINEILANGGGGLIE
jgi:3-deoxy-manno-octulosonate cytidylyltransferase (CMP-KDO synthetase)